MLRHARVSGGQQLAHRHVQWLAAQRFDEPTLRTTFDHYLAVLDARDAAVDATESGLKGWLDRDLFKDGVHRLGAYRGMPTWAP